jgi:hypothetical protein
MKVKRRVGRVVAVTALLAVAWSVAPSAEAQPQTLVQVVRAATEKFQDPEEAKAAGYAMALGCVSGPNEGAMGLHFIKGDLVGDDQLDPQQPEALIYEPVQGKLKLVGVEFIVDAFLWHQTNAGPPVLMGHLTQYVGSPNRYALNAFYELHVWAWKENPKGVFSDWNPKVSCAGYAPEGPALAAANHIHGGAAAPSGASKAAPQGSRNDR